MSDTWITDINHYLDDDGELNQDLPNQALSIALHICSIVEWVTVLPYGGLYLTNVACRRSPGRRRCTGTIHAHYSQEDDAIIWYCPICRDKGAIYGWQGTLWDRRHEYDWRKYRQGHDPA